MKWQVTGKKELVHFKSAHVQLIVRVTEFGMKNSSFSPGCQRVLMQSHLYQLWKGGQRRSRNEKPNKRWPSPLSTCTEGNFQNQGNPWAPNGEISSNPHSTGKSDATEDPFISARGHS